MSVDRRDAERIATLARLSLDEEELERLVLDLNRILDHVRVLQSLDPAAGTDPEPDSELGSTREVAAESPDVLVRPLADFAPDLHEGFFVVPSPPGVQGSSEAP